jgi:hypothetical protein
VVGIELVGRKVLGDLLMREDERFILLCLLIWFAFLWLVDMN